MRVVICVSPAIGGVVSSMFGLAVSLGRSRGAEIEFYGSRDLTTSIQEIAEFHGLDGIRGIYHRDPRVLRNADAYVVNCPWGLRQVLLSPYARIRRSIAVVHGLPLQDCKRDLRTVIWRNSYVPLAGFFCGSIVAVSPEVAEFVKCRAPWRPIPRVIGNSANPFAIWPTARTSDRISLLFNSRFSLEKGSDRILALIHEFRDRDDNLDLIVQSSGEGLERLRSLECSARSDNSPGFRLIIKEPGIPLYDRANILLLPSRQEGDPLAIHEALACGLGVVAAPLPATVNRLGVSLLEEWTAHEVVQMARSILSGIGSNPSPSDNRAQLQLEGYWDELRSVAGTPL